MWRNSEALWPLILRKGTTCTSGHSTMETMKEILPFARELMAQGCSRGTLRMYLLGSGFALCGLVGGLADAASYLLFEQEDGNTESDGFVLEEPQAERIEPISSADTLDLLEEEILAKAKQHPANRQRKLSIRSHAS
ncbi:G0/G1 switch protein 2-like [Denticeps clupeoides]|uniref:Uncharacterized protein n=1 Tax=Denticeps clupeoides TaxID=299321 RepID=A0AAY4BJP6_9TELE|nr:G0/G1 switch protein 2-like [Denticeps clupeoides]